MMRMILRFRRWLVPVGSEIDLFEFVDIGKGYVAACLQFLPNTFDVEPD